MKTKQRSMGYKSWFLVVLGFAVVGAANFACSTASRPATKSEVSEEVSLKADRSQVEDLRKEIPPEVKKENDELALFLQWTGEVKEPPTKVREKYDSSVRKSRDKFNRQVQIDRDSFSADEKKLREEYFRKQNRDRDDFVGSKPTAQQRQSFFSEQETEKRAFLATQKDKRDDFESTIRERRRNFEDYIKSREGAFQDHYKRYVERYREQEKEAREKAKEKEKEEKEEKEREKQKRESEKNKSRLGVPVPKSVEEGALVPAEAPVAESLPPEVATAKARDAEDLKQFETLPKVTPTQLKPFKKGK